MVDFSRDGRSRVETEHLSGQWAQPPETNKKSNLPQSRRERGDNPSTMFKDFLCALGVLRGKKAFYDFVNSHLILKKYGIVLKAGP